MLELCFLIWLKISSYRNKKNKIRIDDPTNLKKIKKNYINKFFGKKINDCFIVNYF